MKKSRRCSQLGSDHGRPLLAGCRGGRAHGTARLQQAPAQCRTPPQEAFSACFLSGLPSFTRVEGFGFPAAGRLCSGFPKEKRAWDESNNPQTDRRFLEEGEGENWSNRGYTCSWDTLSDMPEPQGNGKMLSLDSSCDEVSSQPQIQPGAPGTSGNRWPRGPSWPPDLQWGAGTLAQPWEGSVGRRPKVN